MKIFNQSGQHLFDADSETVAIVTRILLDLERDGTGFVRQYSALFDE